MRKLILFVGKAAAALGAAAFSISAPAFGQDTDIARAAEALRGADVAILGEVHDNAAHHAQQAALLAALKPKAVVWEMITAEQAQLLGPKILADADRTAEVLEWEASDWPEFSLYAPVFAAAPDAQHFGAHVPRTAAREALETGVAAYFGARSEEFGLNTPLAEAEQDAREAEQLASHCDAMPAEMLPVLVDFQRLRDAQLAAAAAEALDVTGGPVAVITGNGHARTDRGLAVYLAQARPEAVIRSLGQSEGGQIGGRFDVVLDAAPAAREDPCLAFRTK